MSLTGVLVANLLDECRVEPGRVFVLLPTGRLQAVVVETDVCLRYTVDQSLARQMAESTDDLPASVAFIQYLHLGPRVVVHEANEGLGERLQVGRPSPGQQGIDGLTTGKEVERHRPDRHHRHVPEADLAGDGRRRVVAHRPEEDARAALDEEVDRLVHASRLRALRVLVVDVEMAGRQQAVGMHPLDGHGCRRAYLLDGKEPGRVLGQHGRYHRLAAVATRAPPAPRRRQPDRPAQQRTQHCQQIHCTVNYSRKVISGSISLSSLVFLLQRSVSMYRCHNVTTVITEPQPFNGQLVRQCD